MSPRLNPYWSLSLRFELKISHHLLKELQAQKTVKYHRNKYLYWQGLCISLHWRHNGHDGVSNHQPHDCLPNRLFRRRSKKISKLRVTGLCTENSPETGEFPAQMASNAENVSIWWRNHDVIRLQCVIVNDKLQGFIVNDNWCVNLAGDICIYWFSAEWAISHDLNQW